jgi:hypothetical protein
VKTRIHSRYIVWLLIPALLFAELASAQTNSNSTPQPAAGTNEIQPNLGLGGAIAVLFIVSAGVATVLYFHLSKKLRRPPPPPGKYNIVIHNSNVPGCNGYYSYVKAPDKAFGSYYQGDSGFAIWGAPTDNTGTNCVWTITDAAFGGTFIVATHSVTRDFFMDTNSVPVDEHFFLNWGVPFPLGAPYQNLPYWPGYTPSNFLPPILGWDYSNPLSAAALASPLAASVSPADSASSSTDPNYYAAWFVIASNDGNDPADFTADSAMFNASAATVNRLGCQPVNTNSNYSLDTNWVAQVNNLWGCSPNLTNSSFGFNGNSVASLPNVSIQFTNGVLSITRSNIVVTGFSLNDGGHGYQNGDTLFVPGGVYTQQAQLKVMQVLNAGTATNMILQLSLADPGLYTVPPPTNLLAVTGGHGSGALVSVSSAATSAQPIRSVPVAVKRGADLTHLTTLFSVQADTNTSLTIEDDNSPASSCFFMVK